MSKSNRVCLPSQPGDSGYFGSYIAINERYLAVGDPYANRVTIYTRNDGDRWTRSKYILPPVNSVPHRIGRGFGRNLELDNDALLISDEVILISPETEPYIEGVVDPKEFQFVDSAPVFAGRYLAKLNSEAEPQRLKFYPNTAPGFSDFRMLSEGKVKRIVLSKNGEDEFGYSAALHKNLFIVGSPDSDTGGGAWLYELDQPEKKPLKLVHPNTCMGTTVAISEQFAAVGERGDFVDFCEVRNLPQKTLIRAIDSGATSVIDEVGILSLSKNILAVMHPETRSTGQPALLKVFYLDRDATPKLILCREDEYLVNAFAQNGFLVTVEDSYSSGISICLESIPQ